MNSACSFEFRVQRLPANSSESNLISGTIFIGERGDVVKKSVRVRLSMPAIVAPLVVRYQDVLSSRLEAVADVDRITFCIFMNDTALV